MTIEEAVYHPSFVSVRLYKNDYNECAYWEVKFKAEPIDNGNFITFDNTIINTKLYIIVILINKNNENV